jgi:hypothetical protein
MAAIGLALVPWLGLVTGLFRARQFLVERYAQLHEAKIDPAKLDAMQHLPRAGIIAIVISTLILALAVAFSLDRYRRHAVLQIVMIAVMPFAAIGLFLLLTGSQLETVSGAALAFALVGAAYYVGYYRLYTMRAGFIYAHPLYPDTGINRRRRRRVAMFAWAALPWLAIVLYFAIAPHFADAVANPAAPSSPWLASVVQELPSASRWAIIPVAMAGVAATGFIVAIALDSCRESIALQRTIIVSIGVLALGTALASRAEMETIVWLYRSLGPLGSMALGLLFLFSTFTLLAVLSQKSGFPALMLVVLAIIVSAIFPVPIKLTATALMIVCAIFVVMAALSRLWAVAIVATLLVLPGTIAWMEKSRWVDPNPPPGSALKDRFKDWLDWRLKDAKYSGAKYPVFVIAVEGGGIYAAAAASLFLAGLEDSNPGFSQHVFAISGVSGGAIGATVFHALARSKLESGPGNSGNATNAGVSSLPASASSQSNECPQRSKSADQPATRRPLAAMVSCIMRDDHFSPVIGALFPELLGASATGRAQALAGSFRQSVRLQDSGAAHELEQSFVDHWSERSEAPALVLNATWAETGFRVAFSPFPLHADDDSLYSFSDEYMPDHKNIQLMDAAVVSARFPAILPPHSVTMKANNGGLRWNFVDGGYSDSSGASTALALYRALEQEAEARHAEIKVILLTSSNPQPDLTPNRVSVNGTVFRDTLAPIAAVMKVREGLGNQAVARVCEHFHMNRNCKLQASDPTAPLKIVEIEDQTYGLSLGWKLSRTTFEVVRWMLGDPDLCKDGNASVKVGQDDKPLDEDEPQLNEQTVRSNSCVLKWVADLLGR